MERQSDVPAMERRRLMLAMGACLSMALPVMAKAHGIGIVDPAIAIPTGFAVLRNDGRRMLLRDLLKQRRTIMQLMFTGCGETCPLQGALFAALQKRLASDSNGENQLLSVSINPMDDARSLATWLHRFGAGRRWIAAVPGAKAIDSIRTALQDARATIGGHSSQVYFINEAGRLIWRTEDFPSSDIVVEIAKHNRWID